jgi:hypothetical protein
LTNLIGLVTNTVTVLPELHAQPPDRVAAALECGDGKEGGVLAIVRADDAPELRDALERGGSSIRLWDNGTPDGD